MFKETEFYNGTGGKGRTVSSGLYFYRLEVAQKNLQKKMMFLR